MVGASDGSQLLHFALNILTFAFCLSLRGLCVSARSSFRFENICRGKRKPNGDTSFLARLPFSANAMNLIDRGQLFQAAQAKNLQKLFGRAVQKGPAEFLRPPDNTQ
jgi:hypothetical protein